MALLFSRQWREFWDNAELYEMAFAIITMLEAII